MYEHCIRKLSPEDQARLQEVNVPISGVSNEVVYPLGQIQFEVTLTNGVHSRSEVLDFLVLPTTSTYSIILGCNAMAAFNAIPSTPHGAIGFPIPFVKSDRRCAVASHSRTGQLLPPPTTRDGLVKWMLNPQFPDQTITIGSTVSDATCQRLKQLLIEYIDVFAWQPSDMTGVPHHMSQHSLNTYWNTEPVVQKRRALGREGVDAMNEQVQDFLKAGIIRPTRYQTWVANPVMVKKSNGAWRMCIDFKDLNKACPKDCYPLPEIDLKIDSLVPYRIKCFLDAYKG
ncbi:uncharacterized protein LOC143533581 [Bidens hawaiensis]|uniref:uncharacterized protein LOC143533581 n=1 Tax=Bidens hawaiensis TaxID=980011 RepID=UPI0040498A16